MIDHVQRAIFSVVKTREEENALVGRGTAFGIRPDLLVSCEHVVRGVPKVLILREEPTFNGEKGTIAEIIKLDEKRDLALLKIPVPGVHPLELSTLEQPDDTTPLLVWTWPAWWKAEAGKAQIEGPGVLRCVPRAAIVTGYWPARGGGISSFSFAGHVEEGMSGGPVVSAFTGEVVGVVTQKRNLDPDEIAENWKANVEHMGRYDFSGTLGPAPDEIVVAQLRLGMGMALPVQELRSFIETFLSGASTYSKFQLGAT